MLEFLVKNCQGKEFKWEYKDFTDVPVETCIERDKLRPGDESIGEAVIMNFYNKYLKKDEKSLAS